ncbi:MAG: methyltransferase domain-containing protein [Pseudomonadota bacterium]
MDINLGSYSYGNFHDNEAELKRLELQANIAKEFEIKILKKYGVTKGKKILDLGCGTGITSIAIAQASYPGNVIGVDANELLIKRACEHKVQAKQSNLKFHFQNVYELNLADKDFDIAYSRFLFQHLQNPKVAIAKIKAHLKTSGMICIADIDERFLLLYPENASFDSLCKAAWISQKNRGGDRSIGRKLVHYLKEANFSNVKLEVFTLSSFDLGFKNFIEITTKYKAEQISQDILDRKTVNEYLEQIQKLPEDTLGIVSIFVATGVK